VFGRQLNRLLRRPSGLTPVLLSVAQDGVALSNAVEVGYPDFTNITYSIAHAQTKDSGSYTLVVSNSFAQSSV